MIGLKQSNKRRLLKMTITPEALANKMETLKKNSSSKVGVVDQVPYSRLNGSCGIPNRLSCRIA